jgi:hypothetical protein
VRLGADTDVQVLSAGGRRPAVVLCPPLPDLAGRLARAGYAVVSVAAVDRAAEVLAALARGALGFEATAVAVIGAAAASSAGVPWLVYRDDPDAAVRWCAEQLPC